MAIVSLICSIISSFASLEYLGIEKDPHSVRHYFTIMSNKMGALHCHQAVTVVVMTA